MEISTEIPASAKTISGAFLILRPHSERRRPRFLKSSPAPENGLLKTVQPPAKRGSLRKAGQSKARQRDVNSVTAKLALLNTHFSFFCPFSHGDAMPSVAAVVLHSPKRFCEEPQGVLKQVQAPFCAHLRF